MMSDITDMTLRVSAVLALVGLVAPALCGSAHPKLACSFDLLVLSATTSRSRVVAVVSPSRWVYAWAGDLLRVFSLRSSWSFLRGRRRAGGRGRPQVLGGALTAALPVRGTSFRESSVTVK